MLNAGVLYTGPQNFRPPSRIPKTRSIDTARRSAFCWANTESGIAGGKRCGEEYEAWKLVANDEYEQPEVKSAAYRREEGRGMCIYHGVVKSTRLVGMTMTMTVKRGLGPVTFDLERGYIACYDTGAKTTDRSTIDQPTIRPSASHSKGAHLPSRSPFRSCTISSTRAI